MASDSYGKMERLTGDRNVVAAAAAELSDALVERTIEQEGLWERFSAEDLRALTPLFHGHINPYGQFALDLDRPSFLEAA